MLRPRGFLILVELRGQLSNPPFLLAKVLDRKWRFASNHQGSMGAKNQGYKSEISYEDSPIRPSQQKRLKPADVDAIVAGYEGGITLVELAHQLGVHKRTVSEALRRQGVPRREHPSR
ncbi:MAG: hypothetical protein JWP19_2185 [Rhodoglobus sp.]|nr:hypothetical protein [Rhodoglobus sp.]